MSEFCKEYALGLYMLARESGLEDEVFSQLQEIDNLFAENPEYTKILALPNVSKEEKNGLLDEAFGGMNEYVLNFLKLITERHAVSEFSGCVKAFGEEYDRAHGILRALAVSAVPLSIDECEKIKTKLQRETGKNIVLRNEIDKEILGGVVVRFDGREIDGSLKRRLSEMLSALK